MPRKKLLIFTALLLGSILFFPGSMAAPQAILVSDNPADYAAAKAVSSAMGVPVLTTPWGRFEGEVLEKLLSLNPGEVLIIGGPVAVVETYSEALGNKGVKVERIWGKDRAETSERVTNWLIGNHRPKGDLYLVDGWDEGAILYILENENAIILALPHHDLVNAIHERAGLVEKMTTSYGRSVYVYPTLVGEDWNSSYCPKCRVMEVDEARAVSLSISRLRNLSREVSDEVAKKRALERASTAQDLAARGEFERAREVLLEGFGIVYSSILELKPAETSSGTVNPSESP